MHAAGSGAYLTTTKFFKIVNGPAPYSRGQNLKKAFPPVSRNTDQKCSKIGQCVVTTTLFHTYIPSEGGTF